MRHRFPPKIISYILWLYYRFNLGHRDIEDLLAERGITISHESMRLWCNKFGAKYSRCLKRKCRGYGDTFFIDEVFVKINGAQHYLWRAVDQDSEVVDVFLQAKRDGVAHRQLMPDVIHDNSKYANNRAEQSHEPTRVRERVMRRFKSTGEAQRFLGTHAAVSNLFNLGRHKVGSQHYRDLRINAFAEWSRAVAAVVAAMNRAMQRISLGMMLPPWLL
jgi:putative transposase